MPKEARWYVGFIGGAILTSLLLGRVEMNGLFRLVLIGGGGWVGGFLLESWFKNR